MREWILTFFVSFTDSVRKEGWNLRFFVVYTDSLQKKEWNPSLLELMAFDLHFNELTLFVAA